VFYNGVTKDDIIGEKKNLRNGIDRKPDIALI
jgi:hypothetical protein